MKCNHCGYISYDHNLACPKCKKDLASLRERLGITLILPITTLAEFIGVTDNPIENFPTIENTVLFDEETFEFDLDDSIVPVENSVVANFDLDT